MDVTPQLLKDVEFRQSLRGYDPDEVDLFLQRVGAGVAQLQGRLAEAISRAEAAEARIDRGETPATAKARPASGTGDQPTQETINRTLLLAQTTADQLLADAREEAASMVGTAQTEAEQLRSTAQTETEELRASTTTEVNEMRASAEADAAAQRGEAEQILTSAKTNAETERAMVLGDVESEARRVAEETRVPLLEEIRELEDQRTALQSDVSLLEQHVDEQRGLIRSSIGRLQSVVDNPGTLRVAEAPPVSEFSSATAEAVHTEREPVYGAMPIDLTEDAAEPVTEAAPDAENEPVDDLDEAIEAVEPQPTTAEAIPVEEVEVEKVEGDFEVEEVEGSVVEGRDVEGSEAKAVELDETTIDEVETQTEEAQEGATAADDEGADPVVPVVAAATGASFIDSFGATAGDSGDVEADIDAELDTDFDIDAELDTAIEVEPAAQDLGYIEPDVGPVDEVVDLGELEAEPPADLATNDLAAAEDDVVPAFDNDDFFVAQDSGESGIEVIDLTADHVDPVDTTDGIDLGEPTQAFVSVGGDEQATGDAFLDELRRAVGEGDETDEDPAMVAFFDDDSEGPTRRFGRGS